MHTSNVIFFKLIWGPTPRPPAEPISNGLRQYLKRVLNARPIFLSSRPPIRLNTCPIPTLPTERQMSESHVFDAVHVRFTISHSKRWNIALYFRRFAGKCHPKSPVPRSRRCPSIVFFSYRILPTLPILTHLQQQFNGPSPQ
jgi:hypothetical protein